MLQRYDEAADALRQAVALSGDDPDVLGMLGEAIVWANDGVVVPEAAGIFRQVLDARPQDPAARFHLALARAQAGEVREAYDMWLALAADTPADTPWRGDLEGLIRQAAEVLGVEPEVGSEQSHWRAARTGRGRCTVRPHGGRHGGSGGYVARRAYGHDPRHGGEPRRAS